MKRPRPAKRQAPERVNLALPSVPDASHPPDANDDLARQVRISRLLDPVAKRQWLAVLPFLNPADRARLADLLRAE